MALLRYGLEIRLCRRWRFPRWSIEPRKLRASRFALPVDGFSTKVVGYPGGRVIYSAVGMRPSGTCALRSVSSKVVMSPTRR